MKKLLIGFLILIVIILVGTYVVIPKNLLIAKTDLAHTSQNSLARYFSNKNNWGKWWQTNNKATFTNANLIDFNGMQFIATNKTQNGLEISIQTQANVIKSNLVFYFIGKDSTALEWKCEMGANNNPLQRINNYTNALAIKKNMTALLNQLHTFIENESNVYELKIVHEIISDTLVISQKAIFPNYPSTSVIYGLIDDLRRYALANAAIIKGQPMMNVTLLDDKTYQIIVAIPVNKKLNKSGNIESKNLIAGTPMLSAIVYGGNSATADALTKLENYKQDHQFTSPGIPYNILITDRCLEADSTKWKTKVCNLLFPWFK